MANPYGIVRNKAHYSYHGWDAEMVYVHAGRRGGRLDRRQLS